MRIATLNVQGFITLAKQKEVYTLFVQNKIDILLIQETHMTSMDQILAFKKAFHIPSWFGLSPQQSCGTAILINPKLNFKLLHFQSDLEGRILILDIQVENVNLSVVNIYAPCVDSMRRDFLYDLNVLLLNCTGYIVLGGDFNTTLLEEERYRRRKYDYTRKILSELIEKFNLVNTWQFYRGGQEPYSREHYSGTQTQIDYIFVDPHIVANNIYLKKQHNHPTLPVLLKISDHALLTLFF